jgi:hypothetical protein
VPASEGEHAPDLETSEIAAPLVDDIHEKRLPERPHS